MINPFPKQIGDIVRCLAENVAGIYQGSHYIVIHDPKTAFEGNKAGGLYWLMEQDDFPRSNFLRGDVPLFPITPNDLYNPDKFAWVGTIRKAKESSDNNVAIMIFD